MYTTVITHLHLNPNYLPSSSSTAVGEIRRESSLAIQKSQEAIPATIQRFGGVMLGAGQTNHLPCRLQAEFCITNAVGIS